MQDLYAAINTMKDPSFIRVEADEVTYPLHVIIRCRTQGTILRNLAILTSISCALCSRLKHETRCLSKRCVSCASQQLICALLLKI